MRLHADHGVQIHCNAGVGALRGERGGSRG